MSTQDELKDLREEISKLRERIAVLENKSFPVAPLATQPAFVYEEPVQIFPPFKVTC